MSFLLKVQASEIDLCIFGESQPGLCYKYKRQVGALTMVVAQVLREEVSVCYTRVGALVL